jgi:hypothetical protein
MSPIPDPKAISGERVAARPPFHCVPSADDCATRARPHNSFASIRVLASPLQVCVRAVPVAQCPYDGETLWLLRYLRHLRSKGKWYWLLAAGLIAGGVSLEHYLDHNLI